MINRTAWTSAVDTFYEGVSNELTGANILHVVELAAQNCNVCPVGAHSYIVQDSADKVFVDSQAGVHSDEVCMFCVWLWITQRRAAAKPGILRKRPAESDAASQQKTKKKTIPSVAKNYTSKRLRRSP
jgi:hypothetical protein